MSFSAGARVVSLSHKKVHEEHMHEEHKVYYRQKTPPRQKLILLRLTIAKPYSRLVAHLTPGVRTCVLKLGIGATRSVLLYYSMQHCRAYDLI